MAVDARRPARAIVGSFVQGTDAAAARSAFRRRLTRA
jgi:hypothetical protein